VITLPLTVAGLALAGVEVYKEFQNKIEGPGALIQLDERYRSKDDDFHNQLKEIDSAPRESLAIFALLFLIQLVDLLFSAGRGGFGFGGLLAGLVVGGLLAAGVYFTVGDSKVPQAAGGPIKACTPLDD
jgi:hypothetical protein